MSPVSLIFHTIVNLCSASKIYEKLILQRIQELQDEENIRRKMFQINDYSNIKIGKNVICNRLNVLNNVIELDWLNLSLISFKLKMKSLFELN